MKTESILAYVSHMQDNVDHYKPILSGDESLTWVQQENTEPYIDEHDYSIIRDLGIPFKEKIDADFSKFISGDGVYVGAFKKTVKDKNGDDVVISVGPGETDSFGWLTGKVRIVYKLDGKRMYDQVYFG